jgi:small subunit ribosomal protein S2
VVAQGGQVLFVGTKRQAQETIRQEATAVICLTLTALVRGVLTNWRTIKQRIDHLKELEARREG